MADRRSDRNEIHTAGEDAFRQIFDAHFGPVFRFFLSRGISREEARDLTQETFLRVYQGLAGYRGEASLKVWIFKISHHVWLSFVRQQRAEKRQGLEVSLQAEGAEELPDTVLASRKGQEDRLLEEERSRLLHAALAGLPSRMRQCVTLRLSGYKYREISIIMQSSIDTVKSLLSQSRKRLQESLRDSFPDFDA
jgi:RNA polymerase sigma-70 factor (ECF subfamily)